MIGTDEKGNIFEYATPTEIKNHILKMETGSRLDTLWTSKGHLMMSDDIDLFVKPGMLRRVNYGPNTYGHVDYFRL